MSDIKIRIEGLPELKQALNHPYLLHGPVQTFLHRSTLTIESEAKQTAPVDTGRYRSSIQSDVTGWRGTVGTNVSYARFIEFGTRPHWPPVGALSPWYSRHGFSSEFPVRRAIGRRGTKARMIFTNALKNSLGAIKRHLDNMGKDIHSRWQRKG